MAYLGWAGKFLSNVKGFYSEMNPATLTGAIDIIIIKQEDGSFKTSPWHVRFGKMGVFWTNQNNVEIEINGKPVNLPMKLGRAGEAFFLQECEDFSLINNSNSNNADKTITLVDEAKSGFKINYDAGGSFEESDPSPQQEETPSCQEFPFHSLLNDVRFQSEEFDKMDVVGLEKEGSLDPEKIPSSDENLFEMEMDTYGKISPVTNGETTNATDRRRTMTCATLDIEEDILPPFSKMRCNSLPEIHLDEITQNLIKDETSDDGKDGDGGGEDDIRCIVGSLPSCSSGFLTPSKVMTSVVDNVEWKWGQLPVPLAGNNSNNRISSDDAQSCDLEDGVAVPNKDVKIPRSNGGEKVKKELVKDIYLDDLKDVDPEMVSLYLYSNVSNYSAAAKVSSKDIDCSSDPGIPVSPFSAPHSPVPFDENPSSTRVRALSCSASDRDGSGLVSTSSRLKIDPSLTNLASQSTSTSSFYDLSMSLCGGVNDLTESVLKEKFEKYKVTYEQLSSDPNILTNPSLVIFMDGKYYKWAVAAPLIMSMLVFKKSLTDAARESLLNFHMPRKVTSQKRGWLGGWWMSREKPIAAPLASVAIKSSPSLAIDSGNESDGSTTVIPDKPSDGTIVQQQPVLSSAADAPTSATDFSEKIPLHEKLFRSLELTSKQIELLNLHDGMNEVTFSVTTKYQGTTKCACCIFLWNWYDKIVVSDIDGTITKSDVLGQVLPLISSNWSDWSQVGIANLYTLIHQNGYRFMYLSARAIGQSRLTRDYLRSVKQGGYLLPVGPLLLSPSSLRSAFHKEVIERKPEEFKIKCLNNILSLFPTCVTNPFTAGFGNRMNDVWAYSTVGIPKSRIFIVDKKGQIRIEKSTTFSSTYSKLSDIVDQVFPSVAVDTEFSLFNFWRDPSINFSEIDAQQFLKSNKTKKAIKSTASMPPTGSSK